MEEKVVHEKKDLNPKDFIISNILVGVLVFFTMVFIYVLFVSYRDHEYKRDINSYGRDSRAQAVRDYENKELTTYGFIDKDKGVVRIPMEKAIEEVVNDYKK